MATQVEMEHKAPVASNGSDGRTAVEPPPVKVTEATPLADPGPYGLVALAVPLVAFSWISIGRVEPTLIPVALSMLFLYGGIGQFVVAMWEMKRGNTFAVTAFGTFGCFNLAAWYFFSYALPKIPEKEHAAAIALFLAVWAIPAAILWIASFRTNMVINLIFGLATALFIFAAFGQGRGDETLIHISGYIGIALSLVAFYGALSALTTETFGRVLLPIRELSKH